MQKTVSTNLKIKKTGVGTNKKEKKQEISRAYPRSYRLDSEIMQLLKKKLEEINKESPKKITEARLIKALILLSYEIDNDKILKAIKEVW
jgi:hypothetical protein